MFYNNSMFNRAMESPFQRRLYREVNNEQDMNGRERQPNNRADNEPQEQNPTPERNPNQRQTERPMNNERPSNNVQQPNNQMPMTERPMNNQRPNNQMPIPERPTNNVQQPNIQMPLPERPMNNERPLNQMPMPERPSNNVQQPINQMPLPERPMNNERPLNQMPLPERPSNNVQQPINQMPLPERPMNNERPLNQMPLPERPSNNVQQPINQMPTQPQPREEDFMQNGDQKILDLLLEALTDEKEDIDYYGRLMNMARTPEDREIIRQVQMDEQKHYMITSDIYYKLTGKQPVVEQIIRPLGRNLLHEYEKRIFGELAGADLYRKLYFAFLNLQLRDMLFEMMTDEQGHAAKFNYLYAKTK